MKRFLIFTVVLLLLVGTIGGFAYFQYVMKPEFIRTMVMSGGQPPTTVSAVPATVETWDVKLPAIGTFRAVQGIDVAPQVSGVVRSIHFNSGDWVEAGATLVRLDDSVEQADLKANVAQLNQAELDLKRQRELANTGNTPRANLEAAQARRDSSAAAVERTRALIAQKTVTARFTGRLGLRQVDVGQYISAGTGLVTLQQLDPIFVDFPVPEQSVNRIATGQAMEVAVDSYPGTIFVGQVQSVDAQVAQDTRTVLVRGELANPDRKLLPGMFANVAVIVGEPRQVVTVPRTAVTYSLYGDSVYVVKKAEPPPPAPAGAPSGDAVAESALVSSARAQTPGSEQAQQPALTVERRFVTVGETRDGAAAIAEGVAAGELVVTSGQIKLQPGMPVVVAEGEALRLPDQMPLH